MLRTRVRAFYVPEGIVHRKWRTPFTLSSQSIELRMYVLNDNSFDCAEESLMLESALISRYSLHTLPLLLELIFVRTLLG